MSFWKNIIALIVVSLLPLLGFYLGMVTQYNFSTFDTVEIKWEVVSALVAIVSAGIIAWQTGLSRKSIQHMESQNKISADSVNEMKKQNGLIRDLEHKKLEMSDLKEFINEKITPYIKEYEQGKLKGYDSLDTDLVVKTNHGVWMGVVHLTGFAMNTFYSNSILQITGLLYEWYGIAKYPIDFSYNTKLEVSHVLTKIGDNLYKILVDEETRNQWVWLIQKDKKSIYEQLTSEEKDKMKLHYDQFRNQSLDNTINFTLQK